MWKKKKTLQNSECSVYPQRKSATDVCVFIRPTDLLCLSVLLAGLPLCFFCSESWEKCRPGEAFWGIIMGYKEKQAGRGRELGEVVGDEWMYRGCKSEQDGRMEKMSRGLPASPTI